MKSLSVKLSLLVMVAAIVVVRAASNPDEITLNQITKYHDWTRINSEPVKVSAPVSIAPQVSIAATTSSISGI